MLSLSGWCLCCCHSMKCLPSSILNDNYYPFQPAFRDCLFFPNFHKQILLFTNMSSFTILWLVVRYPIHSWAFMILRIFSGSRRSSENCSFHLSLWLWGSVIVPQWGSLFLPALPRDLLDLTPNFTFLTLTRSLLQSWCFSNRPTLLSSILLLFLTS